MPEQVRLAVIGAGHVSPLNVAGYLRDPRCDVVAVCDADRELAVARAHEWGVADVHTGIDDVLARDDVDAVEILTPTYLHREHVLAAVAAGKHVSCQKPIANSVADGREMTAAAEAAGVLFRVGECYVHYPPLVRAKELIRQGAIGHPTMLRTKTVVGIGQSQFQQEQGGETLAWRFDGRSPGGHLFDDMVHKYATSLWLFDADVTSVQAVVRRAPAFLEAPMAAIFEYERESLLATLEVAYAPHLSVPGDYYGADEWFEITGTEGLLLVTRAGGRLLGLPPVLLYDKAGVRHDIDDVESDWLAGFVGSCRHFVEAVRSGATTADLSGDMAVKTLQLCFAVYQASNERRPVDPSTIDGAVSPDGWPPDFSTILEDFESYGTR